MNRTLLLLLALTAGSFPGTVLPNDARALPPQAAIVRGVLVPVPREIFLTLDRFAHSNWLAVQRPELADWRPPGTQAQNALLLGALIAEGFIAVEARDTAETKNIGRALRALARGLGIERAMLRRSRSIIDHAESGDWPAVRSEWDEVLPDVQDGMNRIRSAQLAHLVSLGGWLRGTEALTALLGQAYSEENAALLRQPVFLDYFERQLGNMSGGLGNDPVVLKMKAALPQVRAALPSAENKVSRREVRKISRIATDLIQNLGR
ncbi:MAG: hypothetical protein ABIR29_06760 [Chthoniobacterales bacterium]